MTHKTTCFAPITSILGSINHAISGLLFDNTLSSKRTNTEKFSYPNFESSAFSKPDPSELLMRETEIDPLLEAEVFAIYGRRKDAEMVLDSALKAGVITAGDISLFWSLRNLDQNTQAQSAQ